MPYSFLRKSPLNARTQPLTGIPGLADNIAAKGLLQNLVVHELRGSRGKQRKLGVCAGQRRYAALDLLHADKRMAADYPVPVRIVSEGEALAISLIENSQREGLDPFDVLRSFRMLSEEGRSMDYTAALFSAAPVTVKRRLKLANVHCAPTLKLVATPVGCHRLRDNDVSECLFRKRIRVFRAFGHPVTEG